LRLERNFSAPPPLVFALWTTPRLVEVWFGSSHGFRAKDCMIDLRPGGRWRLTSIKGDIVDRVGGIYHEVMPDRRLCYSYHYAGTEFFSVVSIDLEATGEGTVLHLCQTGFPDEQSFIEHSWGWPFALKIMENALLQTHGIGTVWAGLPEARLDGVARDLEAARARAEAGRSETNRDH
jgi:uncharacterized protein YndB with AHSA1/START domain